MMKLKKILAESNVWDRKFGEPLPTLQLNEKAELGGAIIDQIYDLTDSNNHNEARLKLAQAMKAKDLIKAYEALMVLHDFMRDMNDLDKVRVKLDKALFGRAKQKYSDFDAIWGAY